MTSRHRAALPALVLAVTVALAFKWACGQAAPERMAWIAGPTQALVTALTRLEFTWEAGYGYVNLEHRLVLAPSCLGVNFLVAAFSLLAFCVLPALGGRHRQFLALPGLALVAYLATLGVNSARIVLGVWLHDAGASWGWLTPGRVHRLAGSLVYLAALVGLQRLADRALRLGAAWTRWAPWCAYGAVALAVPLANGAFRERPGLFLEHLASVLLVALALTLAARAFGRRRSGPETTPLAADSRAQAAGAAGVRHVAAHGVAAREADELPELGVLQAGV